MSKIRRVVNDLLSIHPSKINSKRSVHHTFEHDGHEVSVFHMQDRPEDPNSYSSHFQVDGEFGKGKKMSMQAGIHILAKVHQHVTQFIHDRKPTEMRFKANTPAKHEIYGKIAQKIADRNGAKMTSDSTTHTIKFNRPNILQRFIGRKY